MSRRVRLYLAIVGLFVVGAMLFGGVAGVAYFPGQPLAGAAFGVLAASLQALAVASAIVACEIFLPRTRLGLALERAPFLVTLAIKACAYSALILAITGSRVGRWAAAYLLWGADAAHEAVRVTGMPVAISIMVVLLVSLVAIMLVQLSGLVGAGTLRDIALGRYHRSRIEERFFLFVDVVGSTPLAERLGPASVHDFLNRVFQVASEPIDETRGEVHQYVGDEVVITWRLDEGRPHAQPLACYFAIAQALESRAADFEREFGAVPGVRGALHAGPVITGEVGGSRRAIVFHGDVMNTASRIENATRELNRLFLASEDALSRLDGTQAYVLEDLGPLRLRGRASPVRVYAVAPRAG